MAMKLAGGCYYGASFLWVSLFCSSQPCGWLTGKIEAKQNFKHKISSHKFSANLTKLSKPSGRPKQCVIRWFLFASVHNNQQKGIQVVFFANCTGE